MINGLAFVGALVLGIYIGRLQYRRKIEKHLIRLLSIFKTKNQDDQYTKIIFKTRKEAKNVLDGLSAIIQTCGFATLSDLYGFASPPTRYTDWFSYHQDEHIKDFDSNLYTHIKYDFGWTSSSEMYITPVYSGYALKLPDAKFIKEE